MDKFKIIYVYDALCGWCYGFSPVIRAIHEEYHDQFDFEVISGGMITGSRTGPIDVVAPYIKTAYKTVEDTTGIKFGEAFLVHLENGEMILDSEKPAIALSVFKSYIPDSAIEFAHDLQASIYYDGKDPNLDEIYRYLAVNFGIDPDEFIYKMDLEEFKHAAYYDFAMTKQLKVNGFPALFLQNKDDHFYMLAKGYTDEQTLELRIENVLKELSGASNDSRSE
ncbi:DsbA family protein [Hufsiella arboris]|uniref:DsbA family protein n=1 Tax=Hufsiella arboris TaxID=2695275 RepID=UPI001F1610C6|nr:DsbA family protein [Hufsiella arboris]